jgi:hypothetical protein
MLVYLSTCHTGGGATTLYFPRRCQCPTPPTKQSTTTDTTTSSKVESILPVRNTVLIFPHHWPHSGDPVQPDDPKIVLRVDLTLKRKGVRRESRMGYWDP